MIAIVDYGVGNLFSLCSSFKAIGAEVTVTSDPDVIRNADKIILPGVGAFGDAIKKLKDTGLDKIITEETKNLHSFIRKAKLQINELKLLLE